MAGWAHKHCHITPTSMSFQCCLLLIVFSLLRFSLVLSITLSIVFRIFWVLCFKTLDFYWNLVLIRPPLCHPAFLLGSHWHHRKRRDVWSPHGVGRSLGCLRLYLWVSSRVIQVLQKNVSFLISCSFPGPLVREQALGKFICPKLTSFLGYGFLWCLVQDTKKANMKARTTCCNVIS